MHRTGERTLNIVAHQDDGLLFLSPHLLQVLQAGHTVRTIFLTAGDNGTDAHYWQERERGIQAAYAQMCSSANVWRQEDAGIAQHPIPLYILSNHSHVSLAFFRLPDGNMDGSGFASTHHTSLQQLWTGVISTIEAVDGSSSYDKTSLIETLTALMVAFQPDHIHTQDYVGSYGDGDHSDHHSVSYLVRAAAQHYPGLNRLTAYEGYPTAVRPANITGHDLLVKQDVFCTYAHFDQIIRNKQRTFPESWWKDAELSQRALALRVQITRIRHWLKTRLRHLIRYNLLPGADGTYSIWLQRQYILDEQVRTAIPSRVEKIRCDPDT